MPRSKKKNIKKASSSRNEILATFQTALSLKCHEGDLVWSRFNGFVPAHAIFFAVIGQILLTKSAEFQYKSESLIIFSIIGLLLGILWLISTVRGFESVEYWNLVAVELAYKMEKIYGIQSIFDRGYNYFKKDLCVSFDIGLGEVTHIRRSSFTRIMKVINTRWTAYLSIVSILVIYIFIISFTILGKFK